MCCSMYSCVCASSSTTTSTSTTPYICSAICFRWTNNRRLNKDAHRCVQLVRNSQRETNVRIFYFYHFFFSCSLFWFWFFPRISYPSQKIYVCFGMAKQLLVHYVLFFACVFHSFCGGYTLDERFVFNVLCGRSQWGKRKAKWKSRGTRNERAIFRWRFPRVRCERRARAHNSAICYKMIIIVISTCAHKMITYISFDCSHSLRVNFIWCCVCWWCCRVIFSLLFYCGVGRSRSTLDWKTS